MKWAGVLWVVLCVLFPFVGVPLLLGYLLFLRIHQETTSQDRWVAPEPIIKYARMRDGVQVRTYVVPRRGGKGGPCMLLACPLGQCGLSIFTPLIMKYGGDYTFVSWDYRGLFGSETPKRRRRISIHEHAEDAIEVLKFAGFSEAAVMVGHSMGVQVSLETALLYPECVGALMLLNGSHGHVFETAFQPFMRLPLAANIARYLVHFLQVRPMTLAAALHICRPVFRFVLPIYATLFGSKLMRRKIGPYYLYNFFVEYLGTIIATQKDTLTYLRLFEELDSHSVYHLLSSIQHPCLIVSGFWDVLTPALVSWEMSRALPNAKHVCNFWSSHVTLLEHPESILNEFDSFLKEMRRWNRASSVEFLTNLPAQ